MTTQRGAGYHGDSHVGLVRTGNEDAYLVAPPLFAVADGLGGHQAGEVASGIAIDTLLATAPRSVDAKALGRAVRSANGAVIDAAEAGRGRTGMGTTLTAAMVDGTCIAIAHVGDSRAYLLHYGDLQQLTQDHSMVADLVRQGQLTAEESRHHPNRSVITRALGSDPNMVADTFEVTAADGDRLLLCTDGLSSMVEDAQIERILAQAATAAEATDALMDAALDAGGQDNVTVVVVEIGRETARKRRRPAGGPRWGVRALWLVVMIGVVVAAAYAAYSYARSQAYLVDEGGYVVVYEGVPGSFAGVSLNWRSQSTTIPVSALDMITAARLRDGIRVDGLGEAEVLLDAYEARASIDASSVAP